MPALPRRHTALPRVYLERRPAPGRHPRTAYSDRYAVVAYKSPAARHVIARWTWWSTEKPSPRASFLVLNQRRCRAVWLQS